MLLLDVPNNRVSGIRYKGVEVHTGLYPILLNPILTALDICFERGISEPGEQILVSPWACYYESAFEAYQECWPSSTCGDEFDALNDFLSRRAPTAVYKRSNRTIGINPLHHVWVDGKLALTRTPKYTCREYIVLHEIGHHLHYRVVSDDHLHSLQAEWRGMSRHTRHNVAGRVSLYATTRFTEFIAETFAFAMVGCRFNDEVWALYDWFGGPYSTMLRNLNV